MAWPVSPSNLLPQCKLVDLSCSNQPHLHTLRSSSPQANESTPETFPTSTFPTSTSTSTSTDASPSKTSGKNSDNNLGAIIGGTVGATTILLVGLLALIWCMCRKRQAGRRPATFDGDMMVKSHEPAGWFEPFRKRLPSIATASSRSHFAEGKTPTLPLEKHSRPESSVASLHRQGENGKASHRYSSSSLTSITEHESAQVPGCLSARTNR